MNLHEGQSSIDAKMGGIMFENESIKDYHLIGVQTIFRTINVNQMCRIF